MECLCSLLQSLLLDSHLVIFWTVQHARVSAHGQSFNLHPILWTSYHVTEQGERVKAREKKNEVIKNGHTLPGGDGIPLMGHFPPFL